MAKLDQVMVQRDQLEEHLARSQAGIRQLQTEIKELHATNARRSSELAAVVKKSKLLADNVRTLRTERENTKIKLSTIQEALSSLRRKSAVLQLEFDKTHQFYKRELTKSFEKRKVLEQDIKDARAEQDAFAKRVESASLEHGSEEDMVIAAQLRLGQIDVLERNVNKLEAENAQLRRDALEARRKFEARDRDLKELEELKLHNRQLVQCVEALESSRQAQEAEAEKFREQADQSEKESDTLRLKLDDLQKNFADIEDQQQSAIDDVRSATVLPMQRRGS